LLKNKIKKSIHRTIRHCHCLMTTPVARAPFYCTDVQMATDDIAGYIWLYQMYVDMVRLLAQLN